MKSKQKNQKTEMEWIRIGPLCPECKVGTIFAVRNRVNNTLCAYCEECDTLWETIDDIPHARYFYDVKAISEFEWGGYATLDEVIAFGWGKYIKQ